ncbi:MAG: helix-turn-helix transcriptional regulator [Deltaproteobacteria bacterium]|nr:helix-turn-helix transcriptional regulator [Deltaproteobacteria bacterium]
MKKQFKPHKILQRRLALNLTQQELATRAGVSESTVCLLEAGKKEPRVNTLAAIATALKSEMVDFFR